ncbi:MAG: D-alanyl-D-alanine carboxypeptidase [Candidatus Peregrinibacteria bacterium]|nr:D-alanyl-D-alanine carboxypeptidase [Candidatus Peregrinibacteria bacterium]
MFASLISFYLATLIQNLPQLTTNEIKPSQFQDILTASPVPQAISPSGPNTNDLNIQASAYIAVDLKSGKTLIQKNMKEQRSIGSITKLITALIILDENNINDVVKVPLAATTIEGSRIWLAEGEKITVRDLLSGMLIHSGNDAAYALAIYNAGSVENFLGKMNDKAKRLGLTQTHFANPAGLDRDGNYSTAEDIATLGTFAYRNAFIRSIVSIPSMTVSSVNGQFKHELKSTNELLVKDPRVKGLKTGYTLEAGKSFVSVAVVGHGSPILTVVLNSPDRFKETESLIDWSVANFIW